jgi:hypothetical protein
MASLAVYQATKKRLPTSGNAGEWLKFFDQYLNMNNFDFLDSRRLSN